MNNEQFDIEFDQCIHMHKVNADTCSTDDDCDIPMCGDASSFVTSGSSVWTLVQKIGSLIDGAKSAIITAIGNISVNVTGVSSAIAESESSASSRHNAVMNKLNNLDTFVELTDADVNEAFEMEV